MQLHLQDIARVALFRHRAKPAQVRIDSDDVETMALKLLDAAREPLETMVPILAAHHIPKGDFALYADLAILKGIPENELSAEDRYAYDNARHELECTIYGEGIPEAVSRRALELLEKRYFR